jgi:hypothetical protein
VGNSACTQGAPIVFLLGWGGGGGGEVFFIFPHSQYDLIKFLMVSHHVSNLFPMFLLCSSTRSLYHLFFIAYALANVVLLHLNKWAKAKELYLSPTLGIASYERRSGSKFFVSYHCHFRGKWKFPFHGLSKFWVSKKKFPPRPIDQFTTK